MKKSVSPVKAYFPTYTYGLLLFVALLVMALARWSSLFGLGHERSRQNSFSVDDLDLEGVCSDEETRRFANIWRAIPVEPTSDARMRSILNHAFSEMDDMVRDRQRQQLHCSPLLHMSRFMFRYSLSTQSNPHDSNGAREDIDIIKKTLNNDGYPGGLRNKMASILVYSEISLDAGDKAPRQ